MSGPDVLTTRSAGSEQPTRSREIRWVAVGDSFTAGTETGEENWPNLVREWIGRSSPMALLNLAQVGAQIEQIEREQLPIATGIDPDLLTLICGGNDVIRAIRLPEDRLAADLDRIYGQIAAGMPETRVLTATYPPISGHALRPRTRRRIQDGMRTLNTIIRKQAAAHQIVCVELADHPGQAEGSNYAADGIHPSGTGHRIAAEVLGSAIEELLNPHRKEYA